MSKQEQRALMTILGLGLIAGGHKLVNAEIGKLGLPHAVGAALVSLALRL